MRVSVRGVDVEVGESGAGPAVVFLHGNPDTGEVWSEVTARLKGARRCLTPDMPGFGGSRAPDDFDVSLEGQARFVGGLLDALGLSAPADLVIHDVGATYGMAFAATSPERLRSLTILNASFFPDYRWHFWARVWRTPLLGELAMGISNWPLFRFEITRGSKRIPIAAVRRSYERFTPETRRMVLRWYRAMDPEALLGWDDKLRAATARIPTQVIWGDRDPYLPPTHADRFGARAVHHLPESGHWAQLEEPERVAALIESFVKAGDGQ
jgi:pimeloyl-ACP methyl ester carboxylesterase